MGAMDDLLRNVETAIGAEELEQRINDGKRLKVKFGVDPTRPDLTFGHLVVFNKLKEFQELGHETCCSATIPPKSEIPAASPIYDPP